MARREITNWSQLQRFQPREIFTPRSEDELAAIVARAGVEGRRIKVMGAGHSFTAIAVTPDFHVTIHALDQLHHVDQSSGVVTVGAGITLKKLNRELDRYGLALTNMGDIDKQSIAGAVSTGTHGTGLAYGGIATQIRGLRMITPNGDVVDIDANHEPELFRCARVGLGALGIITRVTLQAVPSFRLHAVESSHSLDDVLEAWPDTIRVNDHAEFFFMPGGRNAARKINNRTDEPAAPLSRRRYIADKLVAENVGFGVINRVARRLPRAAPTVAKLLNGSEMNRDYVDVSHKVFSTPRWVHFYESEWSVPLDSLVPAIREINAFARTLGKPVTFPIEVRCAAPTTFPCRPPTEATAATSPPMSFGEPRTTSTSAGCGRSFGNSTADRTGERCTPRPPRRSPRAIPNGNTSSLHAVAPTLRGDSPTATSIGCSAPSADARLTGLTR